MTPDQLARVEDAIADLRLEAAENRHGGFLDEAQRFSEQADALTALLREREALRAALQRLHDLGEWKLRHGIWESDEEAQDTYRQALALLTGTTARTEGK